MITANISSENSSIKHYADMFTQNKNSFAGHSIPWLNQMREVAYSQFTQRGFPTIHDEDWKYTSVNSLTKHLFKQTISPDKTIIATLKIASFLPADFNCHLLTFIDGHFTAELSQIKKTNPNTRLCSLAKILADDPEFVKPYLGKIANNEANSFNALNTCFISDGAFIYIAPNTLETTPIYILHLSTSGTELPYNAMRNLILIEEDSQAIIVENFISLGENQHFTHVVSEINLAKRACAEHYKILQENQLAYHIGNLQVKQHQQSCFTAHSYCLSGHLVRSDTNILLNEEHTECNLNGLYLTSRGQHIDHHTVIDHAKPHGKSTEYYKGVLADHSRAVFNGKVFVRLDAQKTNAKQQNKNLLLSNNAEIDTKPQLEIYNDDVQCTHGATVGQLNQDALFYLQTRGINRAEAYKLLIYAFINEILEQIPLTSLKQYISNVIAKNSVFNFQP